MSVFPSFHDLELDRQSIRILHGWKHACENLLTSKLERTAPGKKFKGKESSLGN